MFTVVNWQGCSTPPDFSGQAARLSVLRPRRFFFADVI